MSKSIAIRIDIAEELAAIQRGECAACRLGANHADTSKCSKAPETWKFWDEKFQREGPDDSPEMVARWYQLGRPAYEEWVLYKHWPADDPDGLKRAVAASIERRLSARRSHPNYAE